MGPFANCSGWERRIDSGTCVDRRRPGNHLRALSIRSLAQGRSIWPSLWRIDAATGFDEPSASSSKACAISLSVPDGRHLSFTAGWPSREPWILENYLPASRPADGNEALTDRTNLCEP